MVKKGKHYSCRIDPDQPKLLNGALVFIILVSLVITSSLVTFKITKRHMKPVILGSNYLAKDILDCRFNKLNRKIYIKGENVDCLPRKDNSVLLRWK